jgi:predicted DCC family thiol-disulfide oxidoreductase YuxK
MPLVLFDGVCNLCNGAVQFIIRRDPKAEFQFAPLTSAAASRALASLPSRELPDSVVLVDDGRIYTRSDAALRIARGLRFPWPLAYAFAVVPRGLRDWVYDAVASRRYRWFGRRDQCTIPGPSIRERFLD